MLTPTDAAFLSALDARDVTTFDHRAHVHMAYVLWRRHGDADVVAACHQAILELAVAHGEVPKYHHTRTTAWCALVAAACQCHRAVSFGDLVLLAPELLQSRLLLEHYTPEALNSDEARVGWVEPDLTPLPAHGPLRAVRA